LDADLNYIHALRRVVTPLLMRGESLEAVSDIAESVLPRDRHTALAQTTHARNVEALIQATHRPQ
jgi:hypothetical protein